MRKSLRLCVAFTVYMLVLLASPGISMSQERSKLVDAGVIFSAEQVESWRLHGVDITRLAGVAPPFWTPVSEEIALLEDKLKPYLERATDPAAKVIATRLGSYKRQYVGYTDGGKRWILVNGFCEEFLKRLDTSKGSDTWHDRFVLIMDGGLCFFMVRYDVSRSRFANLEISTTITGDR